MRGDDAVLPDPPASTLREPGFLVSEQQLMLLLGGAFHEGLLEIDGDENFDDLYHSERFGTEYRDLLTSILLLGPAKCPLPSYISRWINIEPLLDARLVEIVAFDETAPLQQKAASLYDRAYSECRKLEYHPLTSPLIRLDDTREVGLDGILDVETTIGEYEYYLARLSDFVDPLVAGLRSIFGYYFDANARDLMSFFSGMNEGFLSRESPSSTEPDFLFSEMELYVADGLSLDRRFGRQELPSYFPADLENFRSLDAQLSSLGRNLQDHVDAGLQFGMRGDPERFLRVHCFWRSFFELANLLLLSEITGDPPFLPTSAIIAKSDQTQAVKKADVADRVQAFRLVLSEQGLLPNPGTFEDVLRMREDQRIRSLRRALNEWSLNFDRAAEEDLAAVTELRTQVQSASEAVHRAQLATRIGTLVGCISLPLAVAEFLLGNQMGGIALAPMGPAISLYSQLKLRKASWVKLGL